MLKSTNAIPCVASLRLEAPIDQKCLVNASAILATGTHSNTSGQIPRHLSSREHVAVGCEVRRA